MKLTTLLVAVAAVAGLVTGLGAYTFHYARGFSYFSSEPEACVNCHVMRDQFESWSHSTHRNWAVCNDCHTPHDFVGKWTTKALNGWNHSVAFTLGNFPEPIFINERNRRIAIESCLDCHRTVVSQMRADRHNPHDLACTSCHGNVGHQGNR